MAGWGGQRPNAGRPAGGISQVRKLLNDAIIKGLNYAGRTKGLEGTPEEVATESAARIVSDMILAGQGSDVIKIMVMAAPKSEDGQGNGKESPVLAALQKLPGLVNGPQSSPAEQADGETSRHPETCDASASDNESVADVQRPFFAPQQTLPIVEPGAPAADRTGPARGTPPPPARVSPDTMGLGTENFEKNETSPESAADSVSGETDNDQRRAQG